eukprot:TRINITY_DN66404_c3_g1_i2.p1 TRINITY_DN66404_c3_g1~~TRINITY_DN66404_c3_g1_i2.p1  ORF type:complete len:109 (+),score=14.19 TRINITY_DN66404_c3_g1_i2:268-594(+)
MLHNGGELLLLGRMRANETGRSAQSSGSSAGQQLLRSSGIVVDQTLRVLVVVQVDTRRLLCDLGVASASAAARALQPRSEPCAAKVAAPRWEAVCCWLQYVTVTALAG